MNEFNKFLNYEYTSTIAIMNEKDTIYGDTYIKVDNLRF